MDDGTLHALLDGALRAESPGRTAEVEAHLAACGDCRARLEAAEDLRGEASGILDAATGEDLAAAPDFSEVVRRAQARPASSSPPGRLRRQARWTRGVAWAASLVLALGTGYLIRDLAGPTVDDASSPAIEREDVEGAAPGSSPAADEVADRGAGVADNGESPVVPPPTPSTEPPTTEPARTDPAPADAPAAERRAEADAESDAAAKAGVAGEPADAGERADAGDREVSLQGLRVSGLGGERVDSAEISAAGFQAVGRWSAITVEAAREILDGPLYVLPRAELLELYTRADTTHRQVLSLQRLQSGVPIQVVQWRGGEEAQAVEEEARAVEDRVEVSALRDATPAASGALPRAALLPDANVVRVVRDEFILELTGSLPAGLLSVLGETADPAS